MSSDFALGATLTFNKQKFVVIGADDYGELTLVDCH